MQKTIKYLQLIEEMIVQIDDRMGEVLDESFLDEVKSNIEVLCAYFSCNPIQAIMVVISFEESKKDEGLNFRAVQRMLGLKNAEVNSYMDMLDELWIRGIFTKKFGRFGGVSPYGREYVLNPKIINAIIKDKPFPVDELPDLRNDTAALEYLYNLISLSGNYDRVSSDQVLPVFDQELNFFKELPFFRKFKKYGLNTREWSLFIAACWHDLIGKPITLLDDLMDHIETITSKKLALYNDLIVGRTPLVKKGLLRITQTRPEVQFELNDGVSKVLRTMQPHIPIKSNDSDIFTVFYPDKIHSKKLVYEPGVKDQIYMLENLLIEDKYQQFRNRMEKAKLHSGLTIILFGAPGTGKTESVLQLAKSTGRSILQVNFDAIKSPYLGENEKLAKTIFTEYYRISKKSKLTPILLFNEADALFSTRTAIANANPVATQTNNAVQNILLDEMERFNGILVATTNFLVNIDDAFERRFLFKLSFGELSACSMAEIWKLKLPILSQEQCRKLADHYRLNGGQIDNVVRKLELNEVLFGIPLSMDEIEKFCREERFQSTQITIGYKLNRA